MGKNSNPAVSTTKQSVRNVGRCNGCRADQVLHCVYCGFCWSCRSGECCGCGKCNECCNCGHSCEEDVKYKLSRVETHKLSTGTFSKYEIAMMEPAFKASNKGAGDASTPRPSEKELKAFVSGLKGLKDKMSTSDSKTTVIESVKSEAKKNFSSALVRVAGEQAAKRTLPGIVSMIEKLAETQPAFVLMAEFLKSDTGEATYKLLLGTALTQVPYLKTNEKVQVVAEELRIQGMATVGNLVVDQVAELLLPFLGQALQVINASNIEEKPAGLLGGVMGLEDALKQAEKEAAHVHVHQHHNHEPKGIAPVGEAE